MQHQKVDFLLSEIAVFDYLFPSLAFAIPFFIASPQLLTGSVVNCLLFLVASKKLKRTVILGTAMLPSLGALLHGAVFGPLTPFLIWFLPVIMISNLVLINSYSFLENRGPRFLAIIFSGLGKTALIYLSALIYFQLHLVPAIFLTTMGALQLLTSLIGGGLAMFILKKSHYERG
jgi:hypothetical protein